MLGEQEKFLIERLRAQTTRTKTPVLATILKLTISRESIPKPPYLSGIVTYEDDQTAIFHKNFVQIHFPVSKICFAFILTSNYRDDVMITSPQQASN
jgi:hypothetical protein